ncbi:hypothetical protein HAX54_022668, partial [Datura stramonium]|nr:hypothetical protein [Datura stramonium]
KFFDGNINFSNILISKGTSASELKNKMQTVLSSSIVIYGEFDGEILDEVVVAVVIDVGFDFLVGSVVSAGD